MIDLATKTVAELREKLRHSFASSGRGSFAPSVLRDELDELCRRAEANEKLRADSEALALAVRAAEQWKPVTGTLAEAITAMDHEINRLTGEVFSLRNRQDSSTWPHAAPPAAKPQPQDLTELRRLHHKADCEAAVRVFNWSDSLVLELARLYIERAEREGGGQ